MRYFILILLGIGSFSQLLAQSHFTGFVENKGQIHSTVAGTSTASVLASAQSGSLTLFFHQDFVSYQLSSIEEATGNTLFHRVDLRLYGAQVQNPVFASEKSHPVFYYTTEKSEATTARAFDEVRYPEVYPGVDWVWNFVDGRFKHEFQLRSGASHEQIRLDITGAKALSINAEGMLVIETEMGLLHENAPLSFINGALVSSSFELKGNSLSYKVNRPLNMPLVIDPSVEWSTYYGGTGNDLGAAIGCDAENNVYIGGTTSSSTLFANLPGFSTFGMGINDALLVKFNQEGQMIWAAYFGGAGNDVGYALDVSPSGNFIALGGYTVGSLNLGAGLHPTAAHQPMPGSNNHDGFIAVFTPYGNRHWSTYYGGNGADYVYGLRWKSDTTLLVVGETSSTDTVSMVTQGTHQQNMAGNGDAFVVSFHVNGTRNWGSYYGGLNRDYFGDVGFLSNGDIVMAGSTNSLENIATSGTHQTFYGGNRDYILVRFSPTGQRIWGTYYGGAGVEELNHMRVDIRDQVYLYGTTSTTSNMGFNGFQMTYGGSGLDGFIGRFNSSGQRLWASYFGGSGWDNGRGMDVDAEGNAYFTGIFASSNLPTSPNAVQPAFGGGGYDATLLKLDSTGNILSLSYFGGSGDDMGHAAVVGSSNKVYITGAAGAGYPLKEPFQSVLRGVTDIMFTSFDVCDDFVRINNSVVGTICALDTVILTATAGFDSYLWNTGDTSQQISVTTAGVYWVTASNSLSFCAPVSDTIALTMAPPIQLDTLFGAQTALFGDLESYAVGQQLGMTYQWNVTGGTVLSGLGTNLIVVVWTQAGIGAIGLTVTDTAGCVDSIGMNVLVQHGVGLENHQLKSLRVYPNPATDFVNFVWEGDATYLIRITDAHGKAVAEPSRVESGYSLDVSTLPSGLYFYKLYSNQDISTHGKFILQSK